MKGKSLALKRISKDIKDITMEPVEGIGIAQLENEPMKYIVNIKILQGIYTNYCVQLLLTFPENYPSKPPKILIYPNQAIDGQYHHHIFKNYMTDENGENFKKFCFDLLDNDFMSTTEENTGWNPSYTIKSVLLQVQNFIGEPDMFWNLPDKNKIEQLMKSMNYYQKSFTVINDNGEKEIKTHTWSNPYPEIYHQKNKEIKNEILDENDEDVKEKDNIRIQEIKDNLTCFMLKSNYIDEPDILL